MRERRCKGARAAASLTNPGDATSIVDKFGAGLFEQSGAAVAEEGVDCRGRCHRPAHGFRFRGVASVNCAIAGCTTMPSSMDMLESRGARLKAFQTQTQRARCLFARRPARIPRAKKSDHLFRPGALLGCHYLRTDSDHRPPHYRSLSVLVTICPRHNRTLTSAAREPAAWQAPRRQAVAVAPNLRRSWRYRHWRTSLLPRPSRHAIARRGMPRARAGRSTARVATAQRYTPPWRRCRRY